MNVLLTGADRGLGIGTAGRLLELGHVVYAGQYLTGWQELADLEALYPDRLIRIPLDVSDLASVQAAAEAVRRRTDSLDMLINNAGIVGRPLPRSGELIAAGYRQAPDPGAPPEEGLSQPYDAMRAAYEVNALGAARVVECFLPLLAHSTVKRLCFVSSEAGSVTASQRQEMFGYCMSKAALNMYVKILFNRLRPAGYTFRLYHPGWVRSYMGGTKNLLGDLEPEVAGQCAVSHWLEPLADEDSLQLIDYTGKIWPY